MAMLTEQVREERIKTALKSIEGDPNLERIPLPWRSQRGQTFTVVDLPLDCVVLNPGSHRIRAQLASHPQRELVERDPFSQEAQEILADLLRKTEGFEDLKANLADVGQNEAGVVT